MNYFTDYKNRYLRATLQTEQVHPIFDPPSPTLIEGIIAMYAMREQSLLNDKFRNSVKRVFQSVGLAPIVSENDPQGTFVTYRGESTPGTIRKEFFETNAISGAENLLDVREIQTVGGLMLDVEMRDSDLQDLDVTDVIELEDSDSNDGEDNGADLAIIAVDSSDEEVEDGQGSKVASQAIVEVEDGDEEVEDGQGSKVASQAIVEVEDSSDEEGDDGQGAKVASQAIIAVDSSDEEGKRDGGRSMEILSGSK
jgi:hypothetical protein